MSPLPGRGRQVSTLLLFAMLFVAAALAAFGAPVGAQTGETTVPAMRELLVTAVEADCPDDPEQPCWDITRFAIQPGEQIRFISSFEGSAQPHDLQVKLASGTLKVPDKPAVGGVYQLEFTAPETIPAAGIEFFCSVHPTSMTGKLLTPAAIAAGGAAGHEVDVPHLGVNFLAYWVGIIAFALLFIVYGLTFFLFKYNETPMTTDHWDRAGEDGRKKMSGGMASIVAVVLAAALIGGIIYVARL